MRTNGQKDVLALRHFSCHQRELPRAFCVFKSARRDGDSQSKATPSASCARGAAHLSKAARVTGAVNISTPCQEVCYSPLPHAADELPGPSHANPHFFSPFFPPFLPSSLPPSLSQYLSNVACRNWRHGL